MTLELNEQEHQYLLNLLARQPVHEALPMVLKLTGQRLAPAEVTPMQMPLKEVK